MTMYVFASNILWKCIPKSKLLIEHDTRDEQTIGCKMVFSFQIYVVQITQSKWKTSPEQRSKRA